MHLSQILVQFRDHCSTSQISHSFEVVELCRFDCQVDLDVDHQNHLDHGLCHHPVMLLDLTDTLCNRTYLLFYLLDPCWSSINQGTRYVKLVSCNNFRPKFWSFTSAGGTTFSFELSSIMELEMPLVAPLIIGCGFDRASHEWDWQLRSSFQSENLKDSRSAHKLLLKRLCVLTEAHGSQDMTDRSTKGPAAEIQKLFSHASKAM